MGRQTSTGYYTDLPGVSGGGSNGGSGGSAFSSSSSSSSGSSSSGKQTIQRPPYLSSGSSSSSGGSSGSGGSSSGSGTPDYVGKTGSQIQQERDSRYMGGYYDKNQDYEARIQSAVRSGQYGEAAKLEALRNNKILGEGLSEATTNRYSKYMPADAMTGGSRPGVGGGGGGGGGGGMGGGGFSGGLGSSSSAISNSYAAVDAYRAEMERAAREAAAALEAKKQQAVNALGSQKNGVQQAGADANAAAERAYYDLIDPNGANAEAMAARGLSASGLAESSMISAGNARQNALNANKRSVNEQLSEIDRAIENARLTGDIATAEQLAGFRQAVAQTGLQSTMGIEALRQQMIDSDRQFGMQEAGMTGFLNGQQTLAGREMDSRLQSAQIEQKMQQLSFEIQSLYGKQDMESRRRLQELQMQAQELSNEKLRLDNIYQGYVNRNAAGQLGQRRE